MRLARSVMRWVIPGLAAVALLDSYGSAVAQQPHTLTGDIRVHKSFHSKILNNDRDVLVYLPPGYDGTKSKRYAVFYMHDGQNLFDGATSFIPGQEWRVDETAQRLITIGKVEALIIVGVYNTKDRVNEYTPAADTKYKMGGKADLYGRMLVEELKPLLTPNIGRRALPNTPVWAARHLAVWFRSTWRLSTQTCSGRLRWCHPRCGLRINRLCTTLRAWRKNRRFASGWTSARRRGALRKMRNKQLRTPDS